jgi:hypothetical protein
MVSMWAGPCPSEDFGIQVVSSRIDLIDCSLGKPPIQATDRATNGLPSAFAEPGVIWFAAEGPCGFIITCALRR